MPRLAIIIVSYNTRDLLHACLRSVFASAALRADQLAVDVMVVDNASHDGSAEMVTAKFPGVALIACEENLGFTRGNNLALAHLGFLPPTPYHRTSLSASSQPDYVLLLNPDTEVQDDALWQMVEFMEETPAAGACGAQLRYGDGSFQHGAFRFPGLFQIGFDLFPMTRIPGAHRLHSSGLNGRYPTARWTSDQPFAVDFVLGAALMVRGEAIAEIGGLDDSYFMYCEEMDWCLRLHETNWQVYAVPTAQVTHYEGQSSGQTPWLTFQRLWRSRFLFYEQHRNHYPPGYPCLIHAQVKIALTFRARRARQRFERGEISGDALAQELDAYAAIINQR